MRRLAVTALSVMGTVTAAVVLASPAAAHTSPISSQPDAGGTIRVLPEDVEMVFDTPLVQTIDGNVSQLVVTDPMHQFISAPQATVDGTTLSTVLNPSMLMDGQYTVSFRAFGLDGHPSQGSWTFTVDHTRAAGTAPSASVSVPASGTVSLLSLATPEGVPNGDPSSRGSAQVSITIDFARSTMCYAIATSAFDGVTAVHIHSASTQNLTVSEEIYLPVRLAAVNAHNPVCDKEDPESLAKLAAEPERFVVMVHTERFPDGAVAGPVRRVVATDSAMAGTTPEDSPSGPPLSLLRGLALAAVIAVTGLTAWVVALARTGDGARRRSPPA